MNAVTPGIVEVPDLSCRADDATIIALSQQLLATEQRLADWDLDRIELSREEAAEVTSESADQAVALMAMRPTRLAALGAKVEAFRRAFQSMVVTEPGGTVEGMGEFEHRLAWSVFDDVLRLAALSAASSPDAALILLASEHAANAVAVNCSLAEVANDNPEWDAYFASQNLMAEAVPQTMAGVVAIAKAIRAEGVLANGGFAEDCEAGKQAAWEFMLRLAAVEGAGA